MVHKTIYNNNNNDDWKCLRKMLDFLIWKEVMMRWKIFIFVSWFLKFIFKHVKSWKPNFNCHRFVEIFATGSQHVRKKIRCAKNFKVCRLYHRLNLNNISKRAFPSRDRKTVNIFFFLTNCKDILRQKRDLVKISKKNLIYVIF